MRRSGFGQFVGLAILGMVLAACDSAAAPSAQSASSNAPQPVAAPKAGNPTTVPTTAPAAGSTAQLKQWTSPPAMTIDPNKKYTAVIKTNEGEMDAELFAKDAPNTVNNFVFLANQHFYENVKFHRIIKGFMVQTGDPTGTGAGGPGYRFNDEPVTRKYTRGTLAMANAGPNTNGSQFFIMHADYPLPPNYTIFGQVTSGLDVLDKIASVPVVASWSGEPSVPTKDEIIQSVTIQEQ
jgi:cyclophilin family peptidyl-prolyl cis-trans isomerase